MNKLKGKPGYPWRAILPVAMRLLASWLLYPDPDAPGSPLHLVQFGGIVILGFAVLCVVHAALAVAFGKSISPKDYTTDQLTSLRDLRKSPRIFIEDEGGIGCVLMVAVIGIMCFAVGLDWPWWYVVPLALPVSIIVCIALLIVFILGLTVLFWAMEKLIRFVVTGSFR